MLSIADLVKLQNIVCHADQRPLASHLRQPAQEKLPESARLFDLSKHRLHDRLAQRVHRRPHLGFQLSLHPLDSAGVFR